MAENGTVVPGNERCAVNRPHVAAKAKIEKNYAKNEFPELAALQSASQACSHLENSYFLFLPSSLFDPIYFLSAVDKMMSIRAISRAIPRSVFRSPVSALRPLSSISRPSLLRTFYKPPPQQTYPAFSTSSIRREPAGDCEMYQLPT